MAERQAGLGRSLNQVIESLTPAGADAPHVTRAADLHDITPQLYRLVLDVQDLRERVGRLEATAAAAHGGARKHAAAGKHDGAAKYDGEHTGGAKKSKKRRNAHGGKKTKKS